MVEPPRSTVDVATATLRESIAFERTLSSGANHAPHPNGLIRFRVTCAVQDALNTCLGNEMGEKKRRQAAGGGRKDEEIHLPGHPTLTMMRGMSVAQMQQYIDEANDTTD